MRGIIFQAFSDFIENTFDYETLDSLYMDSSYPNKGGFSVAGSYEPAYLVSMAEYCVGFFDNSLEKVYYSFGKFAFPYLINKYKKNYDGMYTPIVASNAFSFLRSLNILHHDELKKIYPDAKFPKFDIDVVSNKHLIIDYSSPLDLPYLVHGLIDGCLETYRCDAKVTMTTLKETKNIDSKVCKIYRFEVK